MKLSLPLFLTTLTLLSVVACKKEEADALPKATQEGQHTFGCLVDGKAFVPKPAQATSITRRAPLEGYVYQGSLYISARGDGGVDIRLVPELGTDANIRLSC
ncbi:hypothetical protein [Hymenobacter elongatus]|uniref:Lipoprotein n=1 Tax=Hymenobacter elongatus TaxID=877208 RepID=A0A4Z0PP26_9BACT|nr:hypothetical protein [Hymenobacter elongatus]TGE17604.1 hypothetical protein E5J99_07060 [Hymenobacter elongatus]